LKQERKETSNKAKYFWIFSNTKPKIENKAKPELQNKKGKQWKYFWYFCVLESRNKNKNNKEKEESETWIYKVSTNYDIEMSESSAYLPPSLGFWPKWRSIPSPVIAPS
jgi:hypothetical protein